MVAKSASDTQIEIAERIKHLLNEKGKSRKEMAADLHVTTETLNSWASRGSIKRDNLMSFTRYVGCTTDWLLTGADEGADVLVHPKTHGLEQRHIPVPVLESTDLMAAVFANDSSDHSRQATLDRVGDWIDNPATASELYIPYISGHQHEEDPPGTPRYAVQVSQVDHDMYPGDMSGKMMVMATDLWPNRMDFTMWLRREIDNDADQWGVHAGFYRSDGWSIAPESGDDWWRHAATNRINREFTLSVQRNISSVDDTVINFSKHQWCYLGVMVFVMGWTNIGTSMTRTRMLSRNTNAMRRRKRPG